MARQGQSESFRDLQLFGKTPYDPCVQAILHTILEKKAHGVQVARTDGSSGDVDKDAETATTNSTRPGTEAADMETRMKGTVSALLDEAPSSKTMERSRNVRTFRGARNYYEISRNDKQLRQRSTSTLASRGQGSGGSTDFSRYDTITGRRANASRAVHTTTSEDLRSKQAGFSLLQIGRRLSASEQGAKSRPIVIYHMPNTTDASRPSQIMDDYGPSFSNLRLRVG